MKTLILVLAFAAQDEGPDRETERVKRRIAEIEKEKEILSKVLELHEKLAGLREKYTDEHAEVVRVRRRMDELMAQLPRPQDRPERPQPPRRTDPPGHRKPDADRDIEELSRRLKDHGLSDDERAELTRELAEAFLRRAVGKLERKQFEEALREFTAVIEMAPEHAEAYRHRAMAYRALGRNEAAEKDLETARRLNPRIEEPERDDPHGREGRLHDLERLAAELRERAEGPELSKDERANAKRELDRVEAELKELRRGSRDEHGPKMREKLAEEVKAFLKEFEPETLARLEELRASKRMEEYWGQLQAAAGRMQRLREMKERDPAGFQHHQEAEKLEREAFGLAEKFRQGEGDPEATRTRLREILDKLFDFHFENRRLELERLSKTLESVRQELEATAKRKADEIERRIKEMLGGERKKDY